MNCECGGEASFKDNGNLLWCDKCGYSVQVDPYDVFGKDYFAALKRLDSLESKVLTWRKPCQAQ